MARVDVEIEDEDLDGDHSTVEGIVATCSRCDHQVECFGRSQRSVRRALAMLRDECPEGESNFYVDPDVEDREP